MSTSIFTLFRIDDLESASDLLRKDVSALSDRVKQLENHIRETVQAKYDEWLADVKDKAAEINSRQKLLLTRRTEIKAEINSLSFAISDDTLHNISFPKGYSISDEYGIEKDISVMSVARNTEVFKVTKKQIDEELITNQVLEVLSVATDNFIAMRKVEGKRLCEDVLSRIETIREKVAFIEEKSPETVRAYREKLEQKIKELIGDVQIDEQRILTETAIYADKVAVAEETVRLKSHLIQVEELLGKDEPIGRKLDFIVQEMNREANTTGSKSQDIEITNAVVDIKAEIEKIREQIQNLE